VTIRHPHKLSFGDVIADLSFVFEGEVFWKRCIKPSEFVINKNPHICGGGFVLAVSADLILPIGVEMIWKEVPHDTLLSTGLEATKKAGFDWRKRVFHRGFLGGPRGALRCPLFDPIHIDPEGVGVLQGRCGVDFQNIKLPLRVLKNIHCPVGVTQGGYGFFGKFLKPLWTGPISVIQMPPLAATSHEHSKVGEGLGLDLPSTSDSKGAKNMLTILRHRGDDLNPEVLSKPPRIPGFPSWRTLDDPGTLNTIPTAGGDPSKFCPRGGTFSPGKP
jgi:hypothetical protein